MANNLYEVNCSNLSKLNCKLLYVTQAKYEDDWHSLMHVHPFCELFYVIRGEGEFRIENECYPVHEDDLVIVNANTSHTESSHDRRPLEYIVLGIDGIVLLDNGRNFSISNYEEYKHEILFYIKTLLLEARTKSDYYGIISQDLLEVLIVNIIRRTNAVLTVSAMQKPNHECAYVKQYIDEHFSENLTLDSLAEESHMSKYYLIHAFKKYSGDTPIDYVKKRRLKEACILLRTTDHSLGQIARIIGVSSQSYFSQIFRSEYGISPTEYREESRLN